ncbi:alpha 2 [New Kent County virus]|uniref:Alpha 2 n=1 Tax=New Kent County virus TaxID=2079603 RepID=A0A2K9YNH0_9RHAB|nr:alpha 2 [New Kent County virus]AUW34402.1 alpha 2 [New Kent County virus]
MQFEIDIKNKTDLIIDINILIRIIKLQGNHPSVFEIRLLYQILAVIKSHHHNVIQPGFNHFSGYFDSDLLVPIEGRTVIGVDKDEISILYKFW